MEAWCKGYYSIKVPTRVTVAVEYKPNLDTGRTGSGLNRTALHEHRIATESSITRIAEVTDHFSPDWRSTFNVHIELTSMIVVMITPGCGVLPGHQIWIYSVRVMRRDFGLPIPQVVNKGTVLEGPRKALKRGTIL